MNEQDRELVLKYLGAAFLYGVFVSIPELNKDEVYKVYSVSLNGITVSNSNNAVFDIPNSIDVYPYLRPMSSMTEEEGVYHHTVYSTLKPYEKVDWLVSKHFDYEGLIEKGLAIKVTEENNPYKN